MSVAAEVFRANLNYLLEQTGQSALSTSASAGIPNQTLNEWLRQGRTVVKGRGRDHLESLRIYFNRKFINQFYINSIADFWRGDLLDGFACGVHFGHPVSAPASSAEAPSLVDLEQAVGKIFAVRQWLSEPGRRLSLAETEDGLHLVEVALEHLQALRPDLERHVSVPSSEGKQSGLRCEECGRAGKAGGAYRTCSICESQWLCQRCMIDDLCLDCYQRLARQGQADAITRSDEVGELIGGMTSDQVASIRDRLRQRTTQAEYWGKGR